MPEERIFCSKGISTIKAKGPKIRTINNEKNINLSFRI